MPSLRITLSVFMLASLSCFGKSLPDFPVKKSLELEEDHQMTGIMGYACHISLEDSINAHVRQFFRVSSAHMYIVSCQHDHALSA